MKNISQIINLLKSQNEFAKLRSVEKFDRLNKILPPNISNGIEFMYTKNETLFFVLKHPLFKSECEYNRVTLKNLLTLMPEIGATNIQFIVTNKIKKPTNLTPPEQNSYKEISSAKFINFCKDEKLYDFFESIREKIKNNL